MKKSLFDAVTDTNPAEFSLGLEDVGLAGDVLELAENAGEIGEMVASAEANNDMIARLEQLITANEKTIADGAVISKESAKQLDAELIGIANATGYAKYYGVDSLITSTEGFEEDGLGALTVSTEATKEMMKKGWDATIEFIKKIITAVEDFTKKMLVKVAPIGIMGKRIGATAAEYSKEGYTTKDKSFEDQGLVDRFTTYMIESGNKDLNGATVEASLRGVDLEIKTASQIAGGISDLMKNKDFNIKKIKKSLTAGYYPKLASEVVSKGEELSDGVKATKGNMSVVSSYGKTATCVYWIPKSGENEDLVKATGLKPDELIGKIGTKTVTIDKSLGKTVAIMSLKEIGDIAKVVEGNSDTIRKAMDDGLKSIKEARKAVKDMVKAADDKMSDADKVKLKYYGDVTKGGINVMSSVTINTTMNAIKTTFAAVSACKGSLGKYSK